MSWLKSLKVPKIAGLVGGLPGFRHLLSECLRIGGLAAILGMAVYGRFALADFPEAERPGATRAGQGPRDGPPIKRGAIVFIHGLTGDPKATWSFDPGAGKKVVTWMGLVENDLHMQNFDVFTFGYGSSIFIDKTRVEDAVTTLRSRLDDDLRDYYHVVLIAHSLGGLITRSALLQSGIRDRKGQAVTLITCATPFNGSDLANILKMLTDRESQQIDILTTANELQDVDSRLWDQLHRELKPRLEHYAAFEEKPIALFNQPAAIVVRKESAVLRDCEGQKGFDANHIDIVKPSSVASPIYQWVSEIIAERERAAHHVPAASQGGPDRRRQALHDRPRNH